MHQHHWLTNPKHVGIDVLDSIVSCNSIYYSLISPFFSLRNVSFNSLYIIGTFSVKIIYVNDNVKYLMCLR